MNNVYFLATRAAGGCHSNEFQCGVGGDCIPASWKCDNHQDCDNMEDETSCRKYCDIGAINSSKSRECF